MSAAAPNLAPNIEWARPVDAVGTGVLVLAGSSGRVDTARAELLAAHGATALGLRWFGGEEQPELPGEVALETFVAAIDLLAAESDRLAVIGLSYGAEAALLTAVRDRRIDAVVALAPTDVAWEGQHRHDDDPRRSKWTWDGRPVPFVPLDRHWVPEQEPPAFVEHYRRSRAAASPEVVAAARIPVERFHGELVLVAGGDDVVWPSDAAAHAIAGARSTAGLDTELIVDPAAGHPVVLPGEPIGDLSRRYQVGGDDGAPARIGRSAWPAIRQALRLK